MEEQVRNSKAVTGTTPMSPLALAETTLAKPSEQGWSNQGRYGTMSERYLPWQREKAQGATLSSGRYLDLA